MKDYTEIKKEMVYRNSKTWYGEPDCRPGMISSAHINFCRKYAGKKILDLGCATGNYCLELAKHDFECVGADVNKDYIEIALKKGVKAYAIEDRLPFEDKAFDSVIMFEVLEHVPDTEKILRESIRVAKKNVLITVPCCSAFESLRRYGLTYEHFLELDHCNFFTRSSLNALLARFFNKVQIIEAGPVYPWVFEGGGFPVNILPFLIKKTINLLINTKLLKTKYYTCLFAVASV